MQYTCRKLFLLVSITAITISVQADTDVNDNTNIYGNTNANGNAVVNGNLTVNGNISSSGCIAAPCVNIGISSSNASYGYIVNTMQDNVLADGAQVPFNLNVTTHNITTDGLGNISMNSAGVYNINWTITTSGNDGGYVAFQLFTGADFASAVAIANTTYGVYINSGDDVFTFGGQAKVTLTQPSQQLFLVNVSNQSVNLVSINTGSSVTGAESGMSASINIDYIGSIS